MLWEGREGGWGREGDEGGWVGACSPMAPQYLNNYHVTYYAITLVDIRLIVPRRLHAEQWYGITFDVTWTESLTNKLPGAGVQTRFVHSSKIYIISGIALIHKINNYTIISATSCATGLVGVINLICYSFSNIMFTPRHMVKGWL